MTRITIEITDPEHLRLLERMNGVALILEELHNRKEDFGKLPGYNSAYLLVQGILAELRVGIAARNLRLAASEGVDISTHGVGYRGGDELLCDPLEEMEDPKLDLETASVSSGGHSGG